MSTVAAASISPHSAQRWDQARAAVRQETAIRNLKAEMTAGTKQELQTQEGTNAMDELAEYQAENAPPAVTNDPFGLKDIDQPPPPGPEQQLAELARAEQDTRQVRQEILLGSAEVFLAQAGVGDSAALYLLA